MIYISFIIPCYNVADYLPDTLKSLRSLKDIDDCEFIFINDGSTDNTLDLLYQFAAEFPQAKIISQKNQGVSAARNAGLSNATGKYLLFLDGDDCLKSDTIQIIKKHTGESDVLLTPITIIQSNKQTESQLQLKEGEYSPIALYKSCECFPTLPMLVYRTAIVKENNLHFSSDIHAGEVYTFTCEYLHFCKSIKVAHHSFYLYNIRPSSATHSPNYAKDVTVLSAIDRIATCSDPELLSIPSFTRTLFVLGASFTYNKYAKFGLKDYQSLNTIQAMLSHQMFCYCMKKVAQSFGKWHRDRILAIYMITTGTWGYKLLATFMKILKRS